MLQECSTDSEELLSKVQTTTSNAPPDLLLTNNIKQQPSKTSAHANNLVTEQENLKKVAPDTKGKIQKRHSIATTRHFEQNNIKFEEFPSDSILYSPSNKTTQPVQFSFTLYDLDGHGKITKDDIAGIVSTIYDSIGKKVAVPHYGKKTINVKLTVSPETSKISEKSQNCNNMHKKYHINAMLSDDEANSDSTSDHLEFSKNENNIKTNQLKNFGDINNELNKDEKLFARKKIKKLNESIPKKKISNKKDKYKYKVS